MEPTATPIRIVIADDHALFRDGLRMVLSDELDIEVVGEAADGQETTQLVRKLQPDILLLDLAMPQLTGLDVLKQLDVSKPMRIIMLTASIDKSQILQALRLGARGVVLKESAAELLLQSIRTVWAGQLWLGREAMTDSAEALRSLTPTFREKDRKQPFGLTPREREIVAAIVSGYSNKQIAQEFSLSEDTVKHHLTNIFDKLGVSSRLELAMAAMHHRLLENKSI